MNPPSLLYTLGISYCMLGSLVPYYGYWHGSGLDPEGQVDNIIYGTANNIIYHSAICTVVGTAVL